MLSLLRSFFKLRRLKRNDNIVSRVAIEMEEPLAHQMLSALTHAHVREVRISYENLERILTNTYIYSLIHFLKFSKVQNLKFFLVSSLPAHVIESIFDALKTRIILKQPNNSQEKTAKKTDVLNHLEVNLNGFEGNKLAYFTDYLKTTTTLKKLRLVADSFDSKTALNHTLEAIRQNKSIDSIAINTPLSKSRLTNSQVDPLLKILKNKQLRSLNLNGHRLYGEGLKKLHEELKSQKNLQSLHLLSSNRFQDEVLDDIGLLVESQNLSIQSLSIGNKNPYETANYVTEKSIEKFLASVQSSKKLNHLTIGYFNNDLLATKFANVLKVNKSLESITLKYSTLRPITQYTAIQLAKALNTNTSLTRFIEEQDVNGIYTKELKEHQGSLLINSSIDKKTAKQLEGLLERNKLIKAIQADPHSLPHQLKKFRRAILDDTFFVTVFKVLPEPFLLKYDDLLTKLVISSQTTWNPFKRNQYGAQRISHIISLLSQQAQSNDDASKMTLGYIYKNGFLNQSIDPETAKDIFDSVILTSTHKEVLNEARFERGHLDLIYPNCIDSRTDAANHFDKVSTGSTSIIAARLRDHCINRMNGNRSLILPDENTNERRLDNFRCLDNMSTYFNTLSQTLIKMAEACTAKPQEEHSIEAPHRQEESYSYRLTS